MATVEPFRVASSASKMSIKRMISLKVDNLPYRATADSLNEVFAKYGEIGDVYIPRDYETAESRGFAFVRFYDVRDAEDAMMALNGRKFDGRPLRIQFARYGRVGSPSDRSRSRSCSVPGCKKRVNSCCCMSRSCSSASSRSRSPSCSRGSKRSRRGRSGRRTSRRRRDRVRSERKERRRRPSRKRSGGKHKRRRSPRRRAASPVSSSSYSSLSSTDEDDPKSDTRSHLSDVSLTESARARQKEL